MIRSRGVIAGIRSKSATVLWSGTTAEWPDWLCLRYGSYAAIYERDLWVSVLVNKRGRAVARLPLKVYRRGPQGRDDASDTPYGQLLRSPSRGLDPFFFWLWVSSTIDVYGEAFLGKRRDRGGRPVELVPLHPTKVFDEADSEGQVTWSVGDVAGRRSTIQRRDLVHFRNFSASSARRGLSPLEPLRSTLENETGARAANSAMWRNGGRPSVVLQHPGTLTAPASERLARNWADVHGGVENWAKAAILEEGMTANILPLNLEDLQYVDARRLNREEACAIYDVPPPVVHILDRATYSNITAQMRSMYRDTMAPHLKLLESTLAYELRDGRFGADGDPDFGDDVYAEFLMDEVLRGDFEQRMTAYQQADFMTIAEKREKENLPFIEGTDRIFLNAASLPLSDDGTLEQPQMTPTDLRAVEGRTGRSATIRELDMAHVTRGLTPAAAQVVYNAAASLPETATTDELRALLRGGDHA